MGYPTILLIQTAVQNSGLFANGRIQFVGERAQMRFIRCVLELKGIFYEERLSILGAYPQVLRKKDHSTELCSNVREPDVRMLLQVGES